MSFRRSFGRAAICAVPAAALAFTLLSARPESNVATAPTTPKATQTPAAVDKTEPERPGVGPKTAPRPTRRADAILVAVLDGASGKKLGAQNLRRLADKSGADPLAAALAEWSRLMQGAGGWSELDAFLKAKPGWPGEGRLRSRAETLMPASVSAAERLDFFGEHRPRTARGARLYGEALIASGRQTRGEAEIIRGWRRMHAPAYEEKLYVSRHTKLIAPHHAARFEMLVWRRKLRAAARQATHLSRDHRTLVTAFGALLRKRRGVDKLLARVPATLRTHPALNYARMVWRDKRRRRDSAVKAMQAAAGALGEPKAWGAKRVAFVRDAWEAGRHKDAIALATPHGLEKGKHFAELEWLSGWIMLKNLKDPKQAIGHFSALYYGTVTPVSRARGAYWAGVCARKLGDEERAQTWFRRAAAHPVAFYGQLALEEIGEDAVLTANANVEVLRTSAGIGAGGWGPEARELARAASRLYRAGAPTRARRFVKTLAKQTDAPGAFVRLARISRFADDATGEIIVGKAALERGVPLFHALYPVPDAPDFRSGKVEPALLLSIARQESRFMRGAQSHVGASGLMQLMPATARGVSKELGVPYNKTKLFTSPSYNLSLGDAYLDSMIEFYDGSYVLAIAAYNAGPGNVNKWLKRFGDPRDPDIDPIEWMEKIPFSETRSYVQRVLEGLQMYRLRLGSGSGQITLKADIARGAKRVSSSKGKATP